MVKTNLVGSQVALVTIELNVFDRWTKNSLSLSMNLDDDAHLD